MEDSQSVDMVESWFEQFPSLFEREKRILEQYGFTLDVERLQNEKIVVFHGRSARMKEYPLTIVYSDGYPSFPPAVFSFVPEELTLVRHQRKDSKSLCMFGFSHERWNAGYTAREVIYEAEELIVKYSPLNFNHDYADDTVPEPLINQFPYNEYGKHGLLIPYPFGDYSFSDLKSVQYAKIRYDVKSQQGILIAIERDNEWVQAHEEYYKWFEKSSVYNAVIYKLPQPPHFNPSIALEWLRHEGYIRNPKKSKSVNQFIILTFPDEWGMRGNYRMSWIVLRNIQNSPSWVKCYLVTEDDIEIRTPYGKQLKDKTVSIVGAGSLGSIVATSLAQEGIGTINLIDYDDYEPGNAVRHQVSQFWFGFPKVIGVKNRILQLSPRTKVIPFPVSVENKERTFQTLLESDLIIDTTGNHNVSHYLNRIATRYKVPFIVASVTNGAWSCEVVKYIPSQSGCWICWNRRYNNTTPPSAPKNVYQFAPGCDQPTFVGGISSINIAGGLIVQSAIDIMLNMSKEGQEYVLWSERDLQGNRSYEIKFLPNPPFSDCVVCK
ncbi:MULTISPECIES: ThiF family adenylyltransferase [Bacillaceae]|uniref:HesA/MoeB/ThiF family protein n=1 Tax=Anoxybacillaceae TaxID=3120669 RepID=UPI00135794A7|nr:ThiF family adenylyltransferase [Geobacillus sp. TFV-3]